MTLAQLCSAFVLVSLVIVLLPIKFSFILSGVLSLKVATFCSNPFEQVYYTCVIYQGGKISNHWLTLCYLVPPNYKPHLIHILIYVSIVSYLHRED